MGFWLTGKLDPAWVCGWVGVMVYRWVHGYDDVLGFLNEGYYQVCRCEIFRSYRYTMTNILSSISKKFSAILHTNY